MVSKKPRNAIAIWAAQDWPKCIVPALIFRCEILWLVALSHGLLQDFRGFGIVDVVVEVVLEIREVRVFLSDVRDLTLHKYVLPHLAMQQYSAGKVYPSELLHLWDISSRHVQWR